MGYRTATARGTVKNTGNLTTTYRVRMRTGVFRADSTVDTSRTHEETNSVTLAPGQVSPAITLSRSESLNGLETLSAQVVLDITSPVSQEDIAHTGVTTFVEPAVYGGTWTDTGGGIAGVPDRDFVFNLQGGLRAGDFSYMDQVVWTERPGEQAFVLHTPTETNPMTGQPYDQYLIRYPDGEDAWADGEDLVVVQAPSSRSLWVALGLAVAATFALMRRK